MVFRNFSLLSRSNILAVLIILMIMACEPQEIRVEEPLSLGNPSARVAVGSSSATVNPDSLCGAKY